MSAKKQRSAKFSFYLNPTPEDTAALQWLGRELKKIREKISGNLSVEDIAERTNLKSSQIEQFESGKFHINLGQLRECISKGYGRSLDSLLMEYYEANKESFKEQPRKLVSRNDYAISTPNRTRKDGASGDNDNDDDNDFCRLIIGGDPNTCLWAVPMKKLEGQPMATDLVEIARSRKRKPPIAVPKNSHDGAEVIYVIHGNIEVTIWQNGDPHDYKLKAGDFVHLISREKHKVTNPNENLTALLLIIRVTNT